MPSKRWATREIQDLIRRESAVRERILVQADPLVLHHNGASTIRLGRPPNPSRPASRPPADLRISILVEQFRSQAGSAFETKGPRRV